MSAQGRLNPPWLGDDVFSHEVDLGERIAAYAYNATRGYVVATEKCDGYFSEHVSLKTFRKRVKGLQRLLAYAERMNVAREGPSSSEEEEEEEEEPEEAEDACEEEV